MSNFDSSVYVDTDALTEWGTSLNTINSTAMDCVNSFKKNASLTGAFEGNSATAFNDMVDGFIEAALNCHNDMTDVNNFLKMVVETMENQ